MKFRHKSLINVLAIATFLTGLANIALSFLSAVFVSDHYIIPRWLESLTWILMGATGLTLPFFVPIGIVRALPRRTRCSRR